MALKMETTARLGDNKKLFRLLHKANKNSENDLWNGMYGIAMARLLKLLRIDYIVKRIL